MSLEKTFELYPEVYAKIFRLGVVMERTVGISSESEFFATDKKEVE
jgi:hypothetical protein